MKKNNGTMRFIDVNAMIGPHYAPREGYFPTVGDYLEDMDFYRIDEGLVYHGLASEYDSRYGNYQLLDVLKGHDRLHPCWVLGVPHFGTPTFQEDLTEGIRLGVRLVRFFWGGVLSNISVLDLDTLGDFFEALESHRMPLVISHEGMTEGGEQFVQLKTVCKTFPLLPVILTAPKLGRDVMILYQMLDQLSNFHIDTSGIHSGGVLEEISGRFGANHLIFGTNFPWFGLGQSRIALMYADLQNEEKAAIASGNITCLMEAVR